MKNPFAAIAALSASASATELVIAVPQQITGGDPAAMKALGEMAALLADTEIVLTGSTPAFTRFVDKIEGLDWHVVYAASEASTSPGPLLAVRVHSAAICVELVFDPASTFVRQCYAAWQRQGFASVSIAAPETKISRAFDLPVSALNDELPSWPVQQGWQHDPEVRMLQVVSCFEDHSRDCPGNMQVSVLEVSDESEPANTFRIAARLVFGQEPVQPPAGKHRFARVFGQKRRSH
jgi:hypothetical protein